MPRILAKSVMMQRAHRWLRAHGWKTLEGLERRGGNRLSTIAGPGSFAVNFALFASASYCRVGHGDFLIKLLKSLRTKPGSL